MGRGSPTYKRNYNCPMGWGTFIAGQVIGSVRRAGQRPLSNHEKKYLRELAETPIYGKMSGEDKKLMWNWALLGIFGFHRFKTGKYLSGLFFLFTFGGFFFFWLLDGIKIARGDFKYRDGLTGRQKNPTHMQLPKI